MNVIVIVATAIISVIASAFGSANTAQPVFNESQFVFDGSSSGYIITAGGYSPNKWYTNAYALDLNSGQWIDLPSLPQGLDCFNLVLRDSTVYAVGGQRIEEPQFLNSVQILSTNENTWKAGSVLRYSSGYVLSTQFNGSIYAVGGYPANNVLQAMGCSGAWHKLASSIYSHETIYSAITVLNDKIYVMGCNHQDEMYDISTDTWTAIKMTNLDRCGGRIVSLNGYIYVIGGADAKNERYDPATGESIYFDACLFNSVKYTSVVTDGENIFVIAGRIAGDYSNKVQVYKPDLDLWQSTTQYPVAVELMGAVYVKKLPID